MRMFVVRRVPRLSPFPARTFFSFPPLPSFSSAPQTYRETKVLPYSPQELFDVVANVSSYPQFVPFCTGSRILTASARKEMEPYTMDAELMVGFLSLNERYTSKVTCVPYSSVEAVASSSTHLFKNLSTIWRFSPYTKSSYEGSAGHQLLEPSSEHTLVTLDLSFAFENPVHAAVSSAFFGQVSKQTVTAFEDRCSQVYGN